jgi:hypothetical protein
MWFDLKQRKGRYLNRRTSPAVKTPPHHDSEIISDRDLRWIYGGAGSWTTSVLRAVKETSFRGVVPEKMVGGLTLTHACGLGGIERRKYFDEKEDDIILSARTFALFPPAHGHLHLTLDRIPEVLCKVVLVRRKRNSSLDLSTTDE